MTRTNPHSLSRSGFLILLALADRARHGLAIIEEVEARTDGEVKMGPGSLYGTLKRLLCLGLIEEPPEAPDPDDDDSRRRYYRLTQEGRHALRKEATNLRTLVAAAAGKQILKDA